MARCDSPTSGLWLQTLGGLGYYDGLRFFTVPGTESMPITALAVASNGAVWFGTYQGLSRWDGGTLTDFTTTNGLPDDAITSLCVASSGEVWVGTGYGLSVYDGRKFRNYTVADGLVQNDITALGQTPDGVVWVGTRSGLSRFDGERFSSFTAADGLSGEDVTAINCSTTGQVWVATMRGLARWNGRGFTPFETSVGQVSRRIQAIFAAPDGRLWLGTGRGLSILDGAQATNFHLEDGLGGENVMAILPTPEGFLWIATEGGLDRLDPQIVNYSTKDGLADNRFFDLCATPDALWLGMQWGGLGRFDGKEFTTVLPGLYARKLHRTPDGVLWIGSNKGALRYDGTRLLPGELLPNRWVMAIASDAEGGMWFGDAWAGGGLVRAQTNAQGNFTTKTFTREDGLAHNEVSSILCTSGGETWVGTAAGVSRFSGDTIKSYEVSDGLPSNGVRVLYQAKDGGLWLGTGRGVARYDGHSFSNITAACGMPANRICSIYQSRDGLMWCGTDGRGVCVFDGKAFSMLDTRDGLAGNSILAIAEDKAGDLWFGTATDGLTRYRRKTSPPQVRLTQVRAGGKTVPASEGLLRLRSGEPFAFNYEALDWLTPPEKSQFRIRLRRLGDASPDGANLLDLVTRKTEFDWSTATPGDYALEIQAINLNLVYSQPARLTFSVFRPWYQSNAWRIPLGLLAVAGLVSGFWLASSNWTRRRRAEAMLRESEERFRSMFENAPVGIFHSLPGGRLLKVNPAMTAMLGYVSPEELLSGISDLTTQVYVDPRLRPGIMAALQKHPGWVHYEAVLWRRKDGGQITVDMKGRCIRDATGGVAYLEGFITDITKQRIAETALKESERTFRSLVESLPIGIVISSGPPESVIEYCNPSLQRMLGGSTDVVPKATMFWTVAFPDMAYGEACRRRLHENVEKARETGAMPEPVEMNITCLDGTRKVVLLGLVPLGGKNYSYLIDLTARKEAEAALVSVLAKRTEEWRQATSAALAASEEESRRIGRELHDTLCQDLIGVSRQAEAVALAGVDQEKVSPNMAGRLQNLASLAAAAARHARGLSHALAVSEPVEAPLEESLQGHVRQLENLYGFTCELSLGEALPAWSPEQGAHIIRIMREALVNAARHAQARRVWVDCLQEEHQTILSISSDGIAPQAPDTWEAGLGLRQMQMRAALLGATLNFRPGVRGAVVQLVIPRSSTS